MAFGHATGMGIEAARQPSQRRGKIDCDLTLQAIETVTAENSCTRWSFGRMQLPEGVFDIVQRDSSQQAVAQRQTIPGRSRLGDVQRAATSSACKPFCP